MFLRALGASATWAGRQRLRGAAARIATGLAALALTSGVSACGGGERQDVTEPSGNFQVRVAKAKFPSRQSVPETSNLQLAIKNVGHETIPDLAVTIYTGNPKADGSFNVRLDDSNLANPNRPVWILENRYPKLITPNVTVKDLSQAPSAGAAAAQTDTFQFGAVPPGETKDIAWRVTAVRAGTYTVHYVVAAGLQGKAEAVTANGSPVTGKFAVTIASKPPQTCVNGKGEVTTQCGT
jgi:hypothetical protein